jgi:hypothetical protein
VVAQGVFEREHWGWGGFGDAYSLGDSYTVKRGASSSFVILSERNLFSFLGKQFHFSPLCTPYSFPSASLGFSLSLPPPLVPAAAPLSVPLPFRCLQHPQQTKTTAYHFDPSHHHSLPFITFATLRTPTLTTLHPLVTTPALTPPLPEQ